MINTACHHNYLLEDLHEYKDFKIAKILKCQKCGTTTTLNQKSEKKFEGAVDYYTDVTANNWDEFERNGGKLDDKQDEIFLQRILKIVHNNYELIKMDNGSIDGHFDLLMINGVHSVAVEVTKFCIDDLKETLSAIEKFDEKNQNKYKFDWWVHFSSSNNDNNIREIIKIIKNIENCIGTEKLEKIGSNDIRSLCPESEENLKKMGVQFEFIVGARNFQNKGAVNLIKFTSSMIGMEEELVNIMNVIVPICNEDDNKLKLSRACVNEKHIAIVMASPPEKSFALTSRLNRKFEKREIYKKLEEENQNGIPGCIDVVWIVNLLYFNRQGKMSFQLLKIVNYFDGLHFELIADGQNMLYA